MKAITKLSVPQGSGLLVTINKINGNRAEVHRQGGYYWLNLIELSPVWTIQQFKDYTRRCVLEHYNVTPSAVVLSSFHIAQTEKPEGVTVKLFDYLRSIAEQEIKNQKSNGFIHSIQG